MSYSVQVFNRSGECMFQSDDVGSYAATVPSHFWIGNVDGDTSAIWLFPWSSLSEVRIWEEEDD